jgi:hypothetical protein
MALDTKLNSFLYFLIGRIIEYSWKFTAAYTTVWHQMKRSRSRVAALACPQDGDHPGHAVFDLPLYLGRNPETPNITTFHILPFFES